jgi:hypothetical protein
MEQSRDVPIRLLTSGHNQEMMPSSAAAVEFAGPRQVRVAAVALPEPGPDEVVVTTHFSGISGGRELLVYRSEIDPGLPLDDRVAAALELLDALGHLRHDRVTLHLAGRARAPRCRDGATPRQHSSRPSRS